MGLDLRAVLSTGVATMSSLVQLQVQDTKEQRQRRHESGNARSKQLLIMHTEQLTN